MSVRVGTAVREVLSRHQVLRPIDKLGLASLISIAERGSPLWRYATEELISGHYAYAVTVAERFRGSKVPFEDLVQAACLGLVEAAARWNPHRGVPFIGYAKSWVFMRVYNESRMATATRPLEVAMSQSGKKAVWSDHRELMPSQVAAWEVEDFLVTRLGERDAMVFMERIGLYGPPQTLKQIGEKIGVSVEGTRKIFERAKKVIGPALLAELAL